MTTNLVGTGLNCKDNSTALVNSLTEFYHFIKYILYSNCKKVLKIKED